MEELRLDGHVADVLVRIVERRGEVLRGDGFKLGVSSTSESMSRRAGGLFPGTPGRCFLDALEAQRGNAIIAEVKMGSPKLGDLRGRVNARAQAKTYAAGQAAALSVVVEPDHFFGSYDILEDCVSSSGLPAIAKDFVVSLQQFRWAADAGASAVLLIAALYESSQLFDYAQAAMEMGLVPLIETHTEPDIAKLHGEQGIAEQFDLVGVNNRDLRTFAVDLEHSIRLRPTLPAGAIAVAESGISGRTEVERLGNAGFDAFLIGESLLLAQDPSAKLAELRGVQSTNGDAP